MKMNDIIQYHIRKVQWEQIFDVLLSKDLEKHYISTVRK